ncbi:hypothetical protein SASPL_101152 [Salvia splendens]|uniref:Uncharacterized protein n=1 Tax=Salvia splendens TaxID=180675 RepID=A0A8X8YPK6_SALSN|nr:hypothetical protein SASPL_101152 [Salvia splendens]
MACLNMSSNDQALYNTITGPRISFSNDFLEPVEIDKSYREAPVSTDFEFSVWTYSMISADELLAGDDDYEDVSSLRLVKGASRWRERFGLKRLHSVVPKKSLGSIDEMKASEIGAFTRKK